MVGKLFLMLINRENFLKSWNMSRDKRKKIREILLSNQSLQPTAKGGG
jgi:hypothetical protein